MKRFTFTKNRLIGLICSAVLPAMAIGLGILLLTKDVMLNIGSVITYFIFPLIATALLGWCIFFNCKTWKKCVLSGVILVSFSILFFVSSIITGWTQVKSYEGNEAVQQYSSVKSGSEIMPDLSEVGETTNIKHYNVSSFFYIFSSETDYLICQYAQEEYEIQKTRLDSVYSFQTETITGDFSNCEPMVEIDGCRFKMLSIKDYGLYYPKNIILIGCSDATREIVYLEFNDIELDYISSLKDFIIDECGWKYIR